MADTIEAGDAGLAGAGAGDELDRLVARSSLCPVFQPIVDLVHGDVVGVEALARWEGLGTGPAEAFALARSAGRVAELDRVCQAAALDVATACRLPAGLRLFVNVEPMGSADQASSPLVERSAAAPEVMAEITERSLLQQPADLLLHVRQLRDAGCGIALDDVGAVPDSLALLPLVAPDVIKLDLSLIQAWPNRDQARVLMAVSAYAETNGAVILAEGIEDERDLRQAVALGATLGQGWHFARPGPLGRLASPRHPIRVVAKRSWRPGSPFELVEPATVRYGPKAVLLEISHYLEAQGLALETPPIMLTAFQHDEWLTATTVARYEELAARCPLVVMFGRGVPPTPGLGVRGCDLDPDDPLCREWTVAVIGAHYRAALIARELDGDGPDAERPFEFILTHDHDTVMEAGHRLLRRVRPVPTTP